MVIISSNDLIIEEVQKCLTEYEGHVFFSYDTTFEIGDFFCSPLLARHPYLENDIGFPVAYLFHDSKEQSVHDIFWNWIRKTFPSIKTKGLCATDGEKALINSLGEIVNLRCWNHLLENIKQWVRRHEGFKNDWVFYKKEVKEIIQQETREEAIKLFESLSSKWDGNFKTYFEDYILCNIDSFGRWTLEKYKLYNSFSGLTTNLSEGMNNLLKLLIERTEVPIDVAVMCFDQLQVYYWNEIKRGFACTGSYCLKSKYMNLRQEFEKEELKECINPDDMAKYINELENDLENNNIPSSSSSSSNLIQKAVLV
jgi:hypothetical protein